MVRVIRIGLLPIKVLIHVAGRVPEIVFKVVQIHHVVVNEATAINVLGTEVKTHIVPVSGPNFVVSWLDVREVLGNWQR